MTLTISKTKLQQYWAGAHSRSWSLNWKVAPCQIKPQRFRVTTHSGNLKQNRCVQLVLTPAPKTLIEMDYGSNKINVNKICSTFYKRQHILEARKPAQTDQRCLQTMENVETTQIHKQRAKHKTASHQKPK